MRGAGGAAPGVGAGGHRGGRGGGRGHGDRRGWRRPGAPLVDLVAERAGSPVDDAALLPLTRRRQRRPGAHRRRAGSRRRRCGPEAAGWERVTLRGLDETARAARRSGTDPLAGVRWRLDGTAFFEYAAVVAARPYHFDGDLPDGTELIRWRLWDLQPLGEPALMFHTDAYTLGVETTTDDPPAALRFAVDYDTFGSPGHYHPVGELNLADGQVWIGDARHCPTEPTVVRQGRYVVETFGDEAFRLRHISPPGRRVTALSREERLR